MTELLSKERVTEKYPYINQEGLEGALYIPHDIIVDTPKITHILAELAQQNGKCVHVVMSMTFWSIPADTLPTWDDATFFFYLLAYVRGSTENGLLIYSSSPRVLAICSHVVKVKSMGGPQWVSG